MYFQQYEISSGKPIFVFLKFVLGGNVFFIDVPSTDQYKPDAVARSDKLERYM